MNNYYFIPNNKSVIMPNMILPLENYSIGFDVYYNIDEINTLSKTNNVSIIINKFLHKIDIPNIKEILSKLNNIKYYFIEDLGLTYIINKNNIVISQNHIINNYKSINYFKELGFNNILINNDLTIDEITYIKDNTTSNLFIYYIMKNNLMYSKRHLISSFNTYKDSTLTNKQLIKEKTTNYELLIKEEPCGTCIFNKKIYSSNKYLDKLSNINLIINLSNMTKEETNIILTNYNKKDLNKYIEIDDYFLDNEILYKVGDLK